MPQQSFLKSIKNKKIINEDQMNPMSIYVCDYLIKPIFVWLPHLHMNISNIICWNCKKTGDVTVKEYCYRNVEDISSNGFIVYPRFKCKCHSTCSSLDKKFMEICGVPNNILRRCPVGTVVHVFVLLE